MLHGFTSSSSTKKSPLPIKEAMHWDVLEFEPYEDRVVEKQKTIRCSQFNEIVYARVSASQWICRSVPADGRPRVSVAAWIRHFLGRWRRRLSRKR